MVLSADEQHVLAETEQWWALEAEEPRLLAIRCRTVVVRHQRVSVAIIAAAWAALVLGMLGAAVPAAGVATATSVGWLLWCWRSSADDCGPEPIDVVDDERSDAG